MMKKTGIVILSILVIMLAGCSFSTAQEPTSEVAAAPAETLSVGVETDTSPTESTAVQPTQPEENIPTETAPMEPIPAGNPAVLPGSGLCSEAVIDPLPVGAGEAAPVQIAQAGYQAEWFVPPSTFNMPLEVMRTPDGDILVQSVRSSTLYRVSLDGQVSVYTNLISGYLGAVDSKGVAYLYSAPGGVIWRGKAGGWGEEFVRSALLDTPCSSGFGLAPDGNFYVAYNNCGETSALYMISQDGKIFSVNDSIPQLAALGSTPSGRFLAAGGNRVYEISLMDFQLTQLYELPMEDGVAEGGLAFDTDDNIYLSTGAREDSGQLWGISPFGDIQLIAVIPGNGLSGIEWIPETNEILGSQLMQGSLLGVNVETGAKREIILGNGLVTPMAMGFSTCGSLAVSNDDGGMMALVDPAGGVSRFFSYLSYTPPVPYLAISSENAVYASECAPGLPNGITVMSPGAAEPEDFLRDLTPSGIVWREDGGLVVADTLKGQVLGIAADGNRTVLAEGLGFPQALAQDSQGNLYVTVGGSIISEALPAPFYAQSVLKILPDGSTQTLADVQEGIFGLAVSPAGELYAAGWGSVMRIDPGGGVTSFASGFEGAVGLAFDLAGNLYVSDHIANGIVRISGFPQGRLELQVKDGSGAAFTGAYVQVYAVQPAVRGLAARTDEGGTAGFAAAPGVYTAVVFRDGSEIARLQGVEVLGSETTEVQLVIE